MDYPEHGSYDRFSKSRPALLTGLPEHAAQILAAAIFVLLYVTNVYGRTDLRHFEQAVIDLNTSSYGSALLDSDRFLWFGSMGQGPLRYDGFELKRYRNGPPPLPGPMINAVSEDSNGKIWFGTFSEGVSSYDRNTGKFSRFTHDPENPDSIGSNNLPFTPQALLVDRDDNLWVGTKNSGVSLYNAKNGKWTRLLHDRENRNSLADNTVMAVLQDNKGMMWFGTRSGLCRLNPKNGIWTRFAPEPAGADSLGSGWIYSLLEDRNGILWVGTKERGLNRFDPATENFSRFLHDAADRNSLSSNEIWNLMEDRSGNIWICHLSSENGGLTVFDKAKEAFTRYAHDPQNPHSISTNSIVGILEEPETGTLWVVNGNGIIDKFDQNSSRFSLWQHDPEDTATLSENTILPIIQDRSGIIWVGTGSGGLNRFDRKNKTFRHYKADENDPLSLPQNYITALYEDNEENLWVGTWGGALSLFDRDTGRSKKIFRHEPGSTTGIPASRQIKYITGDRDNPDILWIGTLEGGLLRLDRRSCQFSNYRNDPTNPDSLTDDSVVEIHDDGKGRLWITTYGGGLNILNKKTGRFKHYRHHPEITCSINADALYQVHEDSAGTFWITGKGGLSRFDEKKECFKNYSRASGFPADIVTNLLEDDDGNFWLATLEAGIIKFNPVTETFKRYSMGDGLAADDYFWTSRLITREKEMFFGGPKGMVSFFPDRIRDNPFIPPVRLTAFRQGGRDIELGSAPERLKEITLDWRSNFFEFQFAALNFLRPEKNRYAYMLEGRDTQWYHTGTKPFGRYTGLSGGTYTLRLNGSNNDGIWNQEGTAIKIQVTSPFWRARWFYVLVAVLALLTASAAFHYVLRLNSEINERRLAEKALKAEQALTESSLNALVDTFFIFELETGKPIRWNRAFKRISGYSDKEICQMKAPNACYTEADLQKAAKTMETVFKTGQDSVELTLVTKDGVRVPTEYTASAIEDEEGNPKFVIAVGRDVTERKIAEEALHKLRNYLNNIIDSMPSILVGVDPDCRVTLWNIKASEATGITSTEAKGRRLAGLFPLIPETDKKVRRAIGDGKVRQEKKVPAPVGNDIGYSDITIFPLTGNGVTGAVIRIDDVTELVRIEEMMIQSEKMLSVGGLAAGMAHEINNPLGGILQNTQVVLNRISGDLPANRRAAEEIGISMEKVLKYAEKRGLLTLLDSVRESGERATKIVDNMLSFSRKSDSDFSLNDVSQILDSSVSLASNDYDLEQNYDFKHFEIKREYDRNLSQIPCGETKIQQVFLNILKNGAHAIKGFNFKEDQSPRFILRTIRENTHARIEIEDNGPGMDQETAKRIFEPFFTTKAPGAGTGLGLSISYFIITENHGGTMTVESAPGHGTRFIIRLPLKRNP